MPVIASGSRSPLRDEPGAHLGKRCDHPAHGSRAQRIVAGDEAGERMAGEQAQQQPRPGARVAEIELPVGLRETAHADAAYPPHAIGATFELDAQRGQRRRRGEHVGALEQAADRAFADGHRAQQQGAVDSDLSPGIPISPSPAAGWAQLHRPPSGRSGTVTARPFTTPLCF